MNNEEVKIYLVDIKGQNGNYYWKDEIEQEIEIGDWVIVQNGNSYSLGQVIAEVKCCKNAVCRFTRSGYDSVKGIMTRISIEAIKDRYNTMKKGIIGGKCECEANE